MHSMHGFQQECTTKYDKDVYELFNEAFAQLPIASVINEKARRAHPVRTIPAAPRGRPVRRPHGFRPES